jgi:hypothetical protein
MSPRIGYAYFDNNSLLSKNSLECFDLGSFSLGRCIILHFFFAASVSLEPWAPVVAWDPIVMK